MSAATRPQADCASNEEAESAAPEQSSLRREMPAMKFLFLVTFLAVDASNNPSGEHNKL